MNWSDLKDKYDRHGLVLVLGAGVSLGCGLPTWDRLLQRIIDDLNFENGFNELRDYLSLPAIASLVEARMADRHGFVEHIRDALYRDFPFYPDGVNRSNRRAFVRYVQENNPSLHAIAALCAIPRPDASTYLANPRIRAIVNFNLDGLLQAYVFSRYEKRLLRTVERFSAEARPDKINVYHMHGFLRFDRQQGDSTKEAPDAVVLTEQDYFDFFNQPTSLFNYTFLYLLREYNCCFLGLSMRDDNMRRLLHYSKREHMESLRQEGMRDPDMLRKAVMRHFAILKRIDRRGIDEAIEQSLRPLGVAVLWVDDHTEIPAQFEALHGAWPAVV